MKTNFGIKNFRVFDENGVVFELNPITILTGSNSSGKSSAVKAVFLLNSYLSQIKYAIENEKSIELDKFKIDFSSYPNNQLGRFDRVVNNTSKSKSITFEYSTYSLMLSKDVNVKLVFCSDESDILNNGYLEAIEMSTDEGVFYSSRKGETFCNLNIIKENDYTTFLITECAVHQYCAIKGIHDIDGDISETEYKEIRNYIHDILIGIDKKRRNDIFRYVRTSNQKEMIMRDLTDKDVLEQIKGKKSIFVIPIIDKLASLKRTEVAEFITSELIKEENKELSYVSKIIIESFLKSGFDNFADFFIDAENSSLKKRISIDFRDYVHLLKASDIEIDTKAILILIGGYKLVRRLGENLVKGNTEKEKRRENVLNRLKKWENNPSFNYIYAVVMAWNKIYSSENNIAYKYVEPDKYNPLGGCHHIAYNLLTKFAEALVREVICPDWCGNMSYVSSSRASVKRLYTLETKDDFSQLLQNYFEKKRVYLDDNKYTSREYVADSFMNSWIEKFEIGNSISLTFDSEGLGVQIRLHKNGEKEGSLLADEGYGITQLVSILLQIEIAILSAKGEKINCYLGLEELDYYDIYKFHYEINTISIEEPEIHLHPKYQSLLADMFLEAYEKYNIHFIIETHSEYLIRKLQLLAAKKVPLETNPEKPIFYEKGLDNISIFYVDPKQKQQVRRIYICKDGYLDDTFGEGFYDEATKLSRRLILD